MIIYIYIYISYIDIYIYNQQYDAWIWPQVEKLHLLFGHFHGETLDDLL